MAALRQFPNESPVKWGAHETRWVVLGVPLAAVAVLALVLGAAPLWKWQSRLGSSVGHAASCDEYYMLQDKQEWVTGLAIFVTVVAAALLVSSSLYLYISARDWAADQGKRRATEVQTLDFDYDAPAIRALVRHIAGVPGGRVSYIVGGQDSKFVRFVGAWYGGLTAAGNCKTNAGRAVEIHLPAGTDMPGRLGIEKIDAGGDSAPAE